MRGSIVPAAILPFDNSTKPLSTAKMTRSERAAHAPRTHLRIRVLHMGRQFPKVDRVEAKVLLKVLALGPALGRHAIGADNEHDVHFQEVKGSR